MLTPLQFVKKPQGETGSLYGVNYRHTYLAGGLGEDSPKTHACLRCGNWCWQNFFERPLDIRFYFKKKLSRLKKTAMKEVK
jgi:hypothetical protein